MDKRERKLREALYAHGYRLVKTGGGFQIGDRDTRTVYLGERAAVSLEEVARFVETLDEYGVSSRYGYATEEDDAYAEQGLEQLDMAVTNLSRRRDTLRQHGKHARAARVDDKIRELEEELVEEEAYLAQEKSVRAFLEAHGFRLETDQFGYRVIEETSGTVVLGELYSADLEDAAAFAKSLGMKLPNGL